jgi:hypothetical protein
MDAEAMACLADALPALAKLEHLDLACAALSLHFFLRSCEYAQKSSPIVLQ